MTRRALVCEDDKSIRSLVRVVLRREGFDVDVAEDGRAGIERIDGGSYELIVLDLTMPGIDGYGVVRHIRERKPAQLRRVIVMTAVNEVNRSEFPSPICVLLPKPFDIDTFTRSVRDCARADPDTHTQ